ncbi:riboflavin synthase alpha chain [[Leptolyngbya] sp. PCC 7376]|uniref:riboflavin synthase n=1 Tax=[Leptolyngbya] sp. PCC 7376 TaxID=111781 RepID=UPI00029EF87D|nr:riboflavin synthase [[Leptolyngbya] sp. PCC 7376]AFY39451.1 riboflavin synthase alpha chain [[Leptolyngbya] sp. PCC 7376]
MFTGLIQALGTVKALGGDRFEISISAEGAAPIMKDLEIGDSVAVDGVCLTVEVILEQGFVATASPETLNRTILGQAIARSEKVNIETSLRVGSKIGGHFVTGHVDSVGSLEKSVQTAQAWEMWFTHNRENEDTWWENIAPCLVPKGSIAVNGISLTVAECDRQGHWFKVAVIPHTYAETNLIYLQPGSWVNLEGDILGKYVQRFISYKDQSKASSITNDFLAEHGYL